MNPLLLLLGAGVLGVAVLKKKAATPAGQVLVMANGGGLEHLAERLAQRIQQAGIPAKRIVAKNLDQLEPIPSNVFYVVLWPAGQGGKPSLFAAKVIGRFLSRYKSLDASPRVLVMHGDSNENDKMIQHLRRLEQQPGKIGQIARQMGSVQINGDDDDVVLLVPEIVGMFRRQRPMPHSH